MSIGISIQFLAGRYHATPWSHQVNEGVVEWPPSPWRILRALVSAYYRLPHPPGRSQINQLVTRLAEQPPCYVLPPSSEGHTRHYMPVWKEGKATTTKVFDTFRVVGGGTLASDARVKVVWGNLNLSQDEIELLEYLCRHITYLGRAESWVELSVEHNPISKFDAVPVGAEISTDGEKEQGKVLVPLTASELEGFRAALAVLPQPKRGKAKWKAPDDVLDALEVNISDLHAQGWNGIPGTRWVTYDLKANEKKRSHASERLGLSTYASVKKPTFARFALASNVLPKLTEAVAIGERLHQALMRWSRDEAGNSASVFSGRDESGNYRTDNHQHAWYLPEPNDKGVIEHVIVYAKEGFSSEQALKALRDLPKLWGSEGFDIQTILVNLGQPDDYGTKWGEVGRGRSPLVGSSRKWQSLTPMVLPRHPKRNRRNQPKYDPNTGFQLDGPEQQTLRLLKYLALIPNVDCVERRYVASDGNDWLGCASLNGNVLAKVRCKDSGVRPDSWQSFRRSRYHGVGEKASNRGYWLEIEFENPLQGPIALGYAAHFGLGVFVPVAD